MLGRYKGYMIFTCYNWDVLAFIPLNEQLDRVLERLRIQQQSSNVLKHYAYIKKKSPRTITSHIFMYLRTTLVSCPKDQTNQNPIRITKKKKKTNLQPENHNIDEGPGLGKFGTTRILEMMSRIRGSSPHLEADIVRGFSSSGSRRRAESLDFYVSYSWTEVRR